MKNLIDSSKATLWEWRIAIAWFLLFSLNAVCSAIMIALTNVTWSDLDRQAKFLIIVAICWNWTNTIMAFVSKQASRIKQTGDVFPISSDTQFFTKPISAQPAPSGSSQPGNISPAPSPVAVVAGPQSAENKPK